MSASPGLAIDLFGWKLFEREDAETPPADAVAYTPVLTVEGGDATLDSLLGDVSELVSKSDLPPSGTAGLVARARGDRGRLTAALYSRGYYGGTIDIRLAGRRLEAIEPGMTLPASDGGKVPVAVQVTPGPVFSFGDLRIDIVGGGGGEGPAPDPGAYGLHGAGVAESSLVLAAEERLVADWRAAGRPLAKVTGREVVADHKSRTVDVTLTLEPGPPARFGRVEISGTEKMDPAIVEAQAKIPAGEPYSPDTVRRAGDRLRALQVFDSVRVREGEALDADGTLPVIIEVAERKRRYVGAGVAWSNADGGEVEAHWGHRNLFGGAERLRVEGAVSRFGAAPANELDYRLGATFVKPGVLGVDTDLTAEAHLRQEMPDAFESRSATAKVGLARRFTDQVSGSIAVEIEQSRITDEFGRKSYTLVGLPGELVWDSRDDQLDPSEGFRAVVFSEPIADVANDRHFLVSKGTFSAYRAIDGERRFVLAGRLATGSITGAEVADIPADRRFFAGGGGSVRGYPYQGVGPLTTAGKPIGGRSFVEASAELRIRVTDKIGIVPFVDAGQAYSDAWPQFDRPLKVGVGAGIRYLTPVGPLRLDVAVPLDKEPDDPPVAVYLGLGQSF